MGHCVYTYAKSCRNGSTSIWSLGVEDGKGHRHRILTIAVDPRSRAITQIRGRYNVLPSAKNNKEPRARLPEDAAPLAESARAVDEPRIHQQALLTLSMATDARLMKNSTQRQALQFGIGKGKYRRKDRWIMKVFISHAYTDTPLVKKVVAGLERVGLEVWDATREILPGDNWADKVARALKESEAMVVLFTPDALRSNWVRWKVEYALGEQSYRNRLIPVIVGDPKELPKKPS